jgi:hypothetical protein
MTVHAPRHLTNPDDDSSTLDAPQGTAPWARAMRFEIRQMWKDGTTQLQRFQRYLGLMERERGFQQLDDAFGHPFPSLRAFCLADPPHGIGFDPTVLDALVRETRAITLGELIAEVQALQVHGTNQYSESGHDDHQVLNYGTSSRYHIARLKRDHPEIAEALARGEYRSVHAAAKAAGLVHDPTPLVLLLRAWRHASPEERERFLAEIRPRAGRCGGVRDLWPTAHRGEEERALDSA